MSSDLVAYYEVSPNPDNSACMVTGEIGPGIIFRNIDTVTGEYAFVSRQVIYEAMAEVTGLSVDKLLKLADGQRELVSVKKKNKQLEEKLLKWNAIADKMEEAGIAIRELE